MLPSLVSSTRSVILNKKASPHDFLDGTRKKELQHEGLRSDTRKNFLKVEPAPTEGASQVDSANSCPDPEV